MQKQKVHSKKQKKKGAMGFFFLLLLFHCEICRKKDSCWGREKVFNIFGKLISSFVLSHGIMEWSALDSTFLFYGKLSRALLSSNCLSDLFSKSRATTFYHKVYIDWGIIFFNPFLHASSILFLLTENYLSSTDKLNEINKREIYLEHRWKSFI